MGPEDVTLCLSFIDTGFEKWRKDQTVPRGCVEKTRRAFFAPSFNQLKL